MQIQDEKLKTLSVFSSELAKLLLAEHKKRPYQTDDDLNSKSNIKQREEIIQMADQIQNWIFSSSSPAKKKKDVLKQPELIQHSPNSKQLSPPSKDIFQIRSKQFLTDIIANQDTISEPKIMFKRSQ